MKTEEVINTEQEKAIGPEETTGPKTTIRPEAIREEKTAAGPATMTGKGNTGNGQHKRRGTVDMTSGSPIRLMLTFMIPLLIGNLFQQFYNMVDSMIVGKFVGAEALAAVGATGSLNWMFFSLCNGLGNGTGIVISHYFGAGEESKVRKTIGNAVYILLVSGLLMGSLGFIFSGKVLALLNTPENIIGQSTLYMRIMCIGVLAVAMYNTTSAILRGLGDSVTPLYFLVFSSILNVVLDLFFVCVCHMGVGGAALATIISQLVSALGSLTYSLLRNPMFRLTKESFRPDRDIIWKAVRIGVPMAAQSSLIAFSCVILQSIVNSFGSTVVAAFTATSRIEQLSAQPYQSLSMAVSTFTGQNIGAGREDRVKQGALRGFFIMLFFTAIMTPLSQFGGRFLVGLFVNDPEVIVLGARAIRITSLFFFALGLINLFRGLLNGAGDAMFSLINGVTECAGRIAFPKPLTMIPSIGVWGIWLGTALTWSLVAAVTFIRYRSGAWRPKQQRQYRPRPGAVVH